MDGAESDLIFGAIWLLEIVKISPLGPVCLHTTIQD